MARIRSIKPEFFTSEDIVGLSPLARLLYIALWCEADREGRLVWKPKTFKLRYFPADNCDIDALCGELLEAGLVVTYGNSLAHIPAFLAHQHINPRETASQLPEPDASSTRAPRVTHASSRDSDVQGGRERKGRERKDDASPRDASADADLFPGVASEVVADFRALRKAKKAPITETAVAGIQREAEKAGLTLEQALRACCERGWTGFKAEWVHDARGSPGGARNGSAPREPAKLPDLTL